MHGIRAGVLLTLLAACSTPGEAAATPPESATTDRRILRSPQPGADFFPIPFSYDGRSVFAGARDPDNRSHFFVMDDAGAARIERPADIDTHAFFGRSALIRGDVLFVSATPSGPCEPGHDCRGQVHVFERSDGDGWARQAVIEAGDLTPATRAELGGALAFDGTTLVVGAPALGLHGAVYVFVREGRGWTRRASLRPPSAARGQAFGARVAVDGDRIVVGAPSSALGFDEDSRSILGSLASGRAYVYRREPAGWILEGELSAPSGGPHDELGGAVAIDGGRVAVGAPIALTGRGAVHVFRRRGRAWEREATLQPSGVSLFGSSLALDGDLLAVGAPGVPRREERGAVHVYARCGHEWMSRRVIRADRASTNGFGSVVHLAGRRLASALGSTTPGEITLDTLAAPRCR